MKEVFIMQKRICNAFIVGGICGIVGQLTILLLSLTGLVGTTLIMAAMLLFGILTDIVILTGGYFHVSSFGGSGAAIPLCGLMFGAAMSTASYKKSGDSLAILKGFWSVFKILFTGFILACILGIILGGYPGVLSTSVPSIPAQIIYSSIIGGLISALTQFLTELKLNFAFVAILSMALGGGLLTRLGVIDWLNILGPGGLTVMALGSGNAAYAGGVALRTGTAIPLITVTLLLIILVGMGAICGGYLAKHYAEQIPD